MKKLLFIFILLPFITFSQVIDSIRMTKVNYESVVVEVPNKTKSELYKKTKSWINRFYKNPTEVTKADEIDNYIRLTGSTYYSFQFMGTSKYILHYDLEINFKDGKYKIEFFNVKSPEIMMPDMPSSFFKKGGELKGKKSVNLKMQKAVLESLNNIHYDFYNFINADENKW